MSQCNTWNGLNSTALTTVIYHCNRIRSIMADESPRRSKRRKVEHSPDNAEGLRFVNIHEELEKSAGAVAKETIEIVERSSKRRKQQWMTGVRVPDLIRPRSAYQDGEHSRRADHSERTFLADLVVRIARTGSS